MKKIELAEMVAKEMKKIRPEIDVERTAKTLSKNMQRYELEICLKRYENK